MLKRTVTVGTKEELKMLRESIKENNHTEVNLQYKNGEYILTTIDEPMTKEQLYYAGLISRREARKWIDPQTEKEVRAKERALRSHDNFTLLMPKKSKKN